MLQSLKRLVSEMLVIQLLMSL